MGYIIDKEVCVKVQLFRLFYLNIIHEYQFRIFLFVGSFEVFFFICNKALK
jgi:hypothetical protein